MSDDLLIVVAVAFTAPLRLGLAPRLRLPAVGLEIGAGIALGPNALGLVEVDATLEVVALLGNLVVVPLCLAALLVVRGVPVLLYRLDARRTVAAALLQATSPPFLVTATTIGTEMVLLDGAQAAALVGAGLLSVLLFPLLAPAALRRAPRAMMTV